MENITAINPISIHALHEESDSNQQTMQFADIFQSTLSMRRATRYAVIGTIFVSLFQSTLSMRRATAKRLNKEENAKYFNPRSP